MNCDPIARWYRWLEYAGFGRALERRRVAFLRDVADARRALVLGDGDGRFLVKLVEQNRGASIDYVDVSAGMLELARARVGERANFILGDALSIPLPVNEYDLIVTHFFLDCFDEGDAARLVERVVASARDGARWVISEFHDSGWWARGVIGGLYWFFRVTTGLRTRGLVDHRPLLRAAGFRMEKTEASRAGLLVSEMWAKKSGQ